MLNDSTCSNGIGTCIQNEMYPCPLCTEECGDDPPSIGSDSCNKWFHWKCVKLQREPRKEEQWFCPSCRP